MIGIMAAMHEELNRIVALLENVSDESVGQKLVYKGTLNQQNVEIGRAFHVILFGSRVHYSSHLIYT